MRGRPIKIEEFLRRKPHGPARPAEPAEPPDGTSGSNATRPVPLPRPVGTRRREAAAPRPLLPAERPGDGARKGRASAQPPCVIRLPKTRQQTSRIGRSLTTLKMIAERVLDRLLGQTSRRLVVEDQGVVLPFAALMMLSCLGMAALAVDVGMIAETRRQLQNAADAATLAGARDLPLAPTEAQVAAMTFSRLNGVNINTNQITISSKYVPNDTITVVPDRTLALFFAPVLGMKNKAVNASASATVGTIVAVSGVLPWGVVDPDPDPDIFGFRYGQSYNLKLGSSLSVNGNFQALAIDGTGADIYRADIHQGSTATVRANTWVPTQTGNMNGPTRQGVDDRLGTNNQTWSQVVQENSDGTHTIIDRNSPRIGIIPVIAGLVIPSDPVYVLGFAVFYIESANLQGGDAVVRGRFLNTVVGGIWGPYGQNFGARAVKLTS